MATPPTLVRTGDLVPYRLTPDHPGQPVRQFYLSTDFERWMEDTLPYLAGDRGRQLSPEEQVVEMVERYLSDPGMTGVGEFQRIMPGRQGVVEMKTTDVRLFGWFWRPCIFIAHRGAMKKDLKGPGGVDRLRDEVIGYRDRLRLDPPSFTNSDGLHALLHCQD